MTYGTSANTYLVGRRSSRSSPHRRSRTVPIGKGPAIQHRRRGLIALMAHFAHSNLAPPFPKDGPKTSRLEGGIVSAARKPRTPQGQDAQMKIVSTFMKQRTYLIIFMKQRTYLIIFVKQRTYLTLGNRSPGDG
jgi:hypothetical protein